MKQAKWVLPFFTIAFGIAALLFFALVLPHHLHFQEQYQLFLFDVGYCKEVLAIPGGLADLLGRFFTQFFLLAWVGAAIVALLLVSIVLLLKRCAKLGSLQGLVLAPVFLLWAFYCDENALLGGFCAIILAMLAQWGISAIKHRYVRNLLLLLSVPFLYWTVGPIAILTFVLHLIASVRSQNKLDIWTSILSVGLVALMPVLAHHCVTIPLDQLYYGPHYFRYPLTAPTLLWMTVAGIVLVALLPKIESKPWITLTGWLLVSGAGGMVVKMSANSQHEELMAYDFMARYQQWNRILQTAQKKTPNNSVTCTVLNLALGMKGQLADRMFEYNQNGLSGLLPVFVRDPVSPLATSEAFYQLGMIHTAQRFVFESQEAVPDFQKSGRCYKRLAETNLICGSYKVARKYLDALTKTIFYRQWAKETLALLDDEKAIENHKEYGRLRRMMHQNNIWFSDRETPQMLGQLFMSNRSNRLAFEYLMASYLLERDLDSFVLCLDLGESMNYLQLPIIFQQALMLWWSRDHSAQEKMPQGVNQNIFAGMKQFYALAQDKSINQSQVQTRFGNTYWYYYFYNK